MAEPANVTHDALRNTILTSANASGGWPYYAGKSSRLEPTAWALLALSDLTAEGLKRHAVFLQLRQQPSGWLSEEPKLPINIGFNALVAFSWFKRPTLASDAARAALLAALLTSKGIQVKTVDPNGQDNSLQGWSWIDATFSWVEPTAWGLLALKAARQHGVSSAAADARIAEAEKLLINRTCRTGGWNFGNASVMNQDLRAYVPTTALGLLALQDRRTDPAVARSLEFLEARAIDEPSAPALGLSLICLDVFGRPTAQIEARLRAQIDASRAFGNLHGDAVALCALSQRGTANAFRL